MQGMAIGHPTRRKRWTNSVSIDEFDQALNQVSESSWGQAHDQSGGL